MYKFGNIPGNRSTLSEIADYIEIQCLFSVNSHYSFASARSSMNILSDEIYHNGIESDEDEILDKINEAIIEIQNRRLRCNNKYPFSVSANSIKFTDHETISHWVYIYLLLATRLNMAIDRIHSGVDGAYLFEELSEQIAKSYFGNKSNTIIFGTSSSGCNFEDKIANLLTNLKEGGHYKQPVGSNDRQKDANVDIVVWNAFSDSRGSKLIGFGQCKTGTSWREDISTLRPDAFMRSYTTCQLYHDPVRLFFIADSCLEEWEELARLAGILIDRCRILDYLPDHFSEGLLDKIKKWVNGVLNEYAVVSPLQNT